MDRLSSVTEDNTYITPPIPPPAAPASSGSSAITHSVVSSNEAIDAAFFQGQVGYFDRINHC